MMEEFRLPELGENLESGQVVAVFVSPGDRVVRDQAVLEIETDKAVVEVPSAVEGVVREVRTSEGDEIRVGEVVLTVEAETAAAAVAEESPVAEAKPEPEPEIPAAPAVDSSPAPAPSEPAEQPEPDMAESAPAAPSVRRLARELGVDVRHVAGSGPAGRISRDDVKGHVRQALQGGGPVPAEEAELPDPARWGPVEREPMSRLRGAIAANLSRAWTVVPHVTHHDRADVTELEALRRRYGSRAEAAGGKLTMTALLLKVAAQALLAHPRVNAAIDPARGEIVYRKYVHIGVAVDTERGLLVPVLRDADRKGLLEISVELAGLAERARARRLDLEEMQGAGFTITNLGGIGGTAFTPIVNAPEAAILGVARASREPVYQDGHLAPRIMLPLSLSYDHRLIDGADAARFLRWIVDALEKPLFTLLQE
jgi:pyruvate dehydrogenase E2 component (dihydrolipoamide acetyltransferase)